MTVDEVQGLAGLELAQTVATLMGYNVVASPREIVSAKPPACYVDRSDARGLVCWQAGGGLHQFRPDQSLEDMARVRRFVDALHRRGEFVAALWLLSDEHPDSWWMLDVPAAIQARAFVLMMDQALDYDPARARRTSGQG